MRSITRKALLLLLLLVCAVVMVYASETRPTVALVLSGGGARGYAHIGVIEELEKAGVPIDMVLGTSMGSMIGGMYAAGYSPGDIRRVLNTTDLLPLFLQSPVVHQNELAKAFDNSRYNLFSIGFNEYGFGEAPGFIGDQGILGLLNGLLLRTVSAKTFDDLVIPFRCIGTDLLTGDVIVFDSGSLAEAIRSSISIPLVFPPYAVNDTLVVDGGMVNNMPVLIAREMGADIVIAVDVNSSRGVDEDMLNSLSGIVEQLMHLITYNTISDQYPYADIVITPDLIDVGTMSFFNPDEVIQRGIDAYLEKQDQMDEIIKTIEDAGRIEAVDPERLGPYFTLPFPVIESISYRDISAGGVRSPELNLKLFGQFVGKELNAVTQGELETLIAQMRSRNLYATFAYNLHEKGVDEFGRPLVELELITRTFSNEETRIAFSLSGSSSVSFGNQETELRSLFSIGGKVLLGSLFSTETHVNLYAKYEEKVHVAAEIVVPFSDNPEFTFQAYMGYHFGGMTTENSRFRQDPADDKANDFSTEVDVSLIARFTEDTRIDAGASLLVFSLGHDDTKKVSVFPELYVSGAWNSTGDVIFPRSGERIELMGALGWFNSLTFEFRVNLQKCIPINETNTFSFDVGIGASRMPHELIDSYFNYGSWFGLPGYPNHSLTRDYVIGGLTWQYELDLFSSMPVFLQAKLRAGARDKFDPLREDYSDAVAGVIFSDMSSIDVGLAVGIGISSPIGDIILGLGCSLDGKLAVYLEIW